MTLVFFPEVIAFLLYVPRVEGELWYLADIVMGFANLIKIL